jgi:hypothetical protein
VLSEAPSSSSAIHSLQKKIWQAGSSVSAVCRRANIDERHFQRALLGDKAASRWFIRRCELALQSLVSGEGMPAEPSEIHLRAHYRAFLHQLGVELGVSEAELRSAAPRGQAAVARHAAWYLLSTEFAVRPARIADLFGVTRAAVTQALQTTEDRRDDPAFDRALETIGARIMGRT